MRTTFAIAAATMLAFMPQRLLAESTISQPITRMQYDANADNYYFVGGSGWGAPSCPNAEYVWFSSGVAGYKQLYATVLAAYLAGKSIAFAGSCHTDPNYFTVNYVFVTG